MLAGASADTNLGSVLLRVSIVGGNANNASNDGLGYRNVNNGLTNSNVNIGGRPNTCIQTNAALETA